MENLLARFRTGDAKKNEESYEIDFDAMRARALYPELIGRQVEADKFTPPFMKCDCGMLAVTTRELHGKRTTCESCKRNRALELTSSEAPPIRTMSKRGESRVLFALVVCCIMAAGFFGTRFSDAPPRAHADESHVQLD